MTATRTVLVTGASTGIGECAAFRFDRMGWQVFAGVRKPEDGERLAAQASERFRWLLLDVTDPGQIETARQTVEQAVAGSGLDGLVNNAGIAVGGPLELLPMERFRLQFEVNVFGLMAVTRAFIPLLLQGGGRIVNIGSIAGRVTSPMVGAYSASKHAVEAISDALRQELAPHGVYTSVIEPGVIRTPIWAKGSRTLEGAAKWPEAVQARYGNLLVLFGKVVRRGERHGLDPDLVVDRIVDALTARTPRPRYLVGRDARFRLVLQSILPRRWMDRLVWRMIERHGSS